ncbi:hypothetical protein Dvul_0729 [Nitratidesulfovibrio vulgaris DP4]|uniref:Uncharacterized protein n=1 Tax=Nitratidesulfovibrio vulgaris (strain DP4) TaxID=391774 RepID=A0A0H3A603_NITV4|nr:hypothetical protein Dvul_0729 [Nitratidesulfovibrio vulgaris DP4]
MRMPPPQTGGGIGPRCPAIRASSTRSPQDGKARKALTCTGVDTACPHLSQDTNASDNRKAAHESGRPISLPTNTGTWCD